MPSECVFETTALHVARAGFTGILDLGDCCGSAPDTGAAPIKEMQKQGIIVAENSAELENLL